MSKNIPDVKLKLMTEKDLELLLAWRSHPEAYVFFKAQSGPLHWNQHFNFWQKRENRKDFLILFQENGYWRKVGSTNLSKLNTDLPEIGIIVGELTAHHKGIGSKAVKLALSHLKKMGYTKSKVIIHRDNLASQKLFTKYKFEPVTSASSSPWQTYILETI